LSRDVIKQKILVIFLISLKKIMFLKVI